MTSTNFAYLSNYCVYSAMVLFTIAFISHAVEVSFSVRNVDVKTQFDFSRTKKSGRLGSAMMILGCIFICWRNFSRCVSASGALGEHV